MQIKLDPGPSAMDRVSTEQRLVDIESRLAFQEQALLELSDALAASRVEVARSGELLRRAFDDLGQLRNGMLADAADETPPHW